MPKPKAQHPKASRRSRRRERAIAFRLTRAGWVLLVLSLLVATAAIQRQSAVLYMMFGAMIGAIQVSLLLARGTLRRLSLRRKIPHRVWQNQTVPLSYYLRNSRRRWCLDLLIREQSERAKRPRNTTPVGLAHGLAGAAEAYCPALAGRSTFHAQARFVAARRGRVRFGPIRLSTCFPLGLIEASRRLTHEASLVVWPARGRLTLQLLRHGAVQASSAMPSRSSGGLDEFFGLREYRSGDNPRWINWRRSARTASPVVREMARPRPEILHLVIDAHPRDTASAAVRLERMLRLAATLIDDAFVRGYQVGLTHASAGGVASFVPLASAAARSAMLDSLAEIAAPSGEPSADTRPSDSPPTGEPGDLNKVVAELLRRPPAQLRQAQVVVITFDDRTVSRFYVAAMRALAARAGHLMILAEEHFDDIFIDAPPFDAGAAAALTPAPRHNAPPVDRSARQRTPAAAHQAATGGPP